MIDHKFKCINRFKSLIGYLEEPILVCVYVCKVNDNIETDQNVNNAETDQVLNSFYNMKMIGILREEFN